MTTATTFTFAVFVTAIAIAVAIAFTTTTAAATFAAHHLYETLELFIGSIAKGHHVAFEMKVFASEGMVEVDFYGIILYIEHKALEAVSVSVHEGKYCARVDHVFVKLSVDREGVLGEFEYAFFFVGAIGFLLLEHEVESITFVECKHFLLEGVEGYAHARYELEGMFCGSFFYELVNAFFVVGVEFVCHGDILVGSLFHYLFVCYVGIDISVWNSF